jgi:hypothetical protein
MQSMYQNSLSLSSSGTLISERVLEQRVVRRTAGSRGEREVYRKRSFLEHISRCTEKGPFRYKAKRVRIEEAGC